MAVDKTQILKEVFSDDIAVEPQSGDFEEFTRQLAETIAKDRATRVREAAREDPTVLKDKLGEEAQAKTEEPQLVIPHESKIPARILARRQQHAATLSQGNEAPIDPSAADTELDIKTAEPVVKDAAVNKQVSGEMGDGADNKEGRLEDLVTFNADGTIADEKTSDKPAGEFEAKSRAGGSEAVAVRDTEAKTTRVEDDIPKVPIIKTGNNNANAEIAAAVLSADTVGGQGSVVAPSEDLQQTGGSENTDVPLTLKIDDGILPKDELKPTAAEPGEDAAAEEIPKTTPQVTIDSVQSAPDIDESLPQKPYKPAEPTAQAPADPHEVPITVVDNKQSASTAAVAQPYPPQGETRTDGGDVNLNNIAPTPADQPPGETVPPTEETDHVAARVSEIRERVLQPSPTEELAASSREADQSVSITPPPPPATPQQEQTTQKIGGSDSPNRIIASMPNNPTASDLYALTQHRMRNPEELDQAA